ncbi:hypothetical protein O3M35_009827 [Rhynocoris fuscipes]|uniref:Uncharacterized protein n=1 Tax=Rhynocoris fuscipes TaxID=488301 RepID=A0AAW1D7X9_9HEMI
MVDVQNCTVCPRSVSSRFCLQPHCSYIRQVCSFFFNFYYILGARNAGIGPKPSGSYPPRKAKRAI